MENGPLRLVFGALPSRVRPLDHAELARVFGGCAQPGDFCSADKNCCKGPCQWPNDPNVLAGTCRS